MALHRLIIVDDHPLFRDALRLTLDGDGFVVEAAADLGALDAALEQNRDCDLVLLDLNMPGVRGFSGLLLLRAQFPEIPVVIVSATEDAATIRQAFQLGVSGYLSKSMQPAEIRRAIELVLAGDIFVPPGISLATGAEDGLVLRRLASLTPQQIRVLMKLRGGLMNKQIAHELSISEATVKAHVSAILQKLGVDTRTQAVLAAALIEEGRLEEAAPPAASP